MKGSWKWQIFEKAGWTRSEIISFSKTATFHICRYKYLFSVVWQIPVFYAFVLPKLLHHGFFLVPFSRKTRRRKCFTLFQFPCTPMYTLIEVCIFMWRILFFCYTISIFDLNANYYYYYHLQQIAVHMSEYFCLICTNGDLFKPFMKLLERFQTRQNACFA